MGEADRYLNMAKEADILAVQATDRQARNSWKYIADSYRELASLKASLRRELRNSRL
jgi:hypothetical protein